MFFFLMFPIQIGFEFVWFAFANFQLPIQNARVYDMIECLGKWTIHFKLEFI